MILSEWVRRCGLPADFVTTIDVFYRPIADRIAAWRDGRPLVVGINGGQGTGKTTMALFLKHLLEQEKGLSTAVFSIDDLYLPRQDRLRLAEEVHPLLKTRGVPGTHDPDLGIRVIAALTEADAAAVTRVPAFSKALDDRLPVEQWPMFHGRAEVVILEGWCVGARPQLDAELAEPLNDLERLEDADGRWRRHVNEQLAGGYRRLFAHLDRLFFLRAPDMDCIRRWRGEQEEKLRGQLQQQGGDASGLMDGPALDRFIAHYQRLTEHQWRNLPMIADAVLSLDCDHRIRSIDWKAPD